MDGQMLRLRMERLRLIGISLPWVRRIAWQRSLAPRIPYQPYKIQLRPLHLDEQRLWIADTPEDH